jgi:hypothetical protein
MHKVHSPTANFALTTNFACHQFRPTANLCHSERSEESPYFVFAFAPDSSRPPQYVINITRSTCGCVVKFSP